MNMLNKLNSNKQLKASGLYLLGNIFDKGIAFITIPIFTRLLTPSEYGIVSNYGAWVTVFTIIIAFNLGATTRNAYVDYKNTINQYLSSIFTISALIASIITVISMIIIPSLTDNITRKFLLLCIIQSFGAYIINTHIVKYMMSFNYKKRTLLLTFPNLIGAMLSIMLMFNMTNEKYYGRIYATALTIGGLGLILFIKTLIKGKVLINIEYWKYGLSLSIPLIFQGLSVVILSVSDRIMITQIIGPSETGIYSLVYNLGMIAMVFTNALEGVWIPWFTKEMNMGNKNKINEKVVQYINVVLLLICCLLLVSPEILVILAPKDYWGGTNLIPPVILASFMIFLYSISVNVEYYYKKTNIIARNTMFAALLNLILNLIFIPHFRALGAAYATFFSYSFSFFMHYRYCRKLDRDLFQSSLFVQPIIISLVCSIAMYLFLDYVIFRWGIAVVLVIMFLSMFKKMFFKD